MTFSPQQELAIKAVRAWLAEKRPKPFFYLAGYAGTGKTFLAKHLAEEAGKVVFAAFTGKAALVLAGKGCSPSSTIHSLIYKPQEDDATGITRFILNHEDSPASEADLIVIDEVSMVGAELGRDLLSFGRPILVLGDPAQLPPVGDDTGFFTRHEPDFMLTEIHRQAADNPIIAMSMTIRTGGRLEVGNYGASRVIRRTDLSASDAVGADQVLCGMNKTRRLKNGKMRQLLGFSGAARFLPRERVVALRNNRDKGLLNGSIWRVEEVEFSDADETEMIVFPLDAGMTRQAVEVKTHHAWLEGREKELDHQVARAFDPFDYAYVLSVHKAQGSQWDNVVILDESRVFREDAARWLYTAVTRAAERVTVAI
ncbi:ATP-binding protein [Microcystis phage Mae-JY30]